MNYIYIYTYMWLWSKTVHSIIDTWCSTTTNAVLETTGCRIDRITARWSKIHGANCPTMLNHDRPPSAWLDSHIIAIACLLKAKNGGIMWHYFWRTTRTALLKWKGCGADNRHCRLNRGNMLAVAWRQETNQRKNWNFVAASTMGSA